MSVFSLAVGSGNPVTTQVLDDICNDLGMKIKDDEKDEYQRLLAVYHDSVVSLLELPGNVQLVLCRVKSLLFSAMESKSFVLIRKVRLLARCRLGEISQKECQISQTRGESSRRMGMAMRHRG